MATATSSLSVGERLLIEAARMPAPKSFAGALQRTDLTGSSQCFRYTVSGTAQAPRDLACPFGLVDLDRELL